jgi:hypothetical protein
MKKRKNGLRKLLHSQHYSQIKLTMQAKNEMIRKPFVECKQKLSLNQSTIQKVKTIQNSKEIKDYLSNKHPGTKS